MVKHRIPRRGDIVLLNFNPQAGREQAGIRPALVISPFDYNKKVGLALFCPITRHIKGYPFEVLLPENQKTKGVILSDHVKNLDWQKRIKSYLEKVSENTLDEVLQRIAVLLERETTLQ